MNYEFAYPCDDPITTKINIIGGQNYFLVCIGNLNYLHSEKKPVIDKIRGLLFLENVVLHSIPDDEMIDILLFPETAPFQLVHGNKALLKTFLERGKAA